MKYGEGGSPHRPVAYLSGTLQRQQEAVGLVLEVGTSDRRDLLGVAVRLNILLVESDTART
jgi:hypothetical protein